ncbi:anthranilate phosphoribosyltransferase [Orbilia brochopaga]|uniref:Anthranilate phosphoribosyltransferase n=1 Tax=Orbilia brochopaga TaxID=3140254 RepID=A0AAV9U4P5_9PEZI
MSVSITPLLKLIAQHHESPSDTPSDALIADIQAAFAAILNQDAVPDTQKAALLTALTFSNLYCNSQVVNAIVKVMRDVGVRVPIDAADAALAAKKAQLKRHNYHGGFVDIVGTGGDGHNTFNVSTTSALLASPFLLVTKHGNRAATSLSGSSDMISALAGGPHVLQVPPASVATILAQHSNLAFLFAQNYHPALGPLANLRKELGFSTIFNVLGPLSHPIGDAIEARLLGVKNRQLGKVFAEVLQLMGCQKAMVVCGDVGAGLDEISPAGRTFCWRLVPGPAGSQPRIVESELHPSDFGLAVHPLDECRSRSPSENAEIVRGILRGEVPVGDPIMDYCLINTAALLVVAGVVDGWREGVELVKGSLKTREALRQWEGYLAGCEAAKSLVA